MSRNRAKAIILNSDEGREKLNHRRDELHKQEAQGEIDDVMRGEGDHSK